MFENTWKDYRRQLRNSTDWLRTAEEGLTKQGFQYNPLTDEYEEKINDSND